MKKTFAMLIMMSLSTLFSFAGSDIKVIDGNNKIMKTIEGNAIFEIIWDNATFDDKMPLTDRFDNLKEIDATAKNGFCETFNEKSKKLKVSTTKANAQYKISLKVNKVDQYFNVMGFIPGNATKVWGILTISDLNSGQALTVIEVTEIDGGASPSPLETFSDTFEELAKQVTKLK